LESAVKLWLRPFDYSSIADLTLMAKWTNDPECKHLSGVHRSEADYATVETTESIAERTGKPGKPTHWSWMCLADGLSVGECSLQFDPPHGLHQEPMTAWYGILLGEEGRGRGYGRTFFTMLEEESRRLGARQAELGVFAFNVRAIRLYEGLGYERIGEIPDFTLWNGKFWADFRYFKRFVIG
jgi:RimJ/RimL family protein N-acetyltransferase